MRISIKYNSCIWTKYDHIGVILATKEGVPVKHYRTKRESGIINFHGLKKQEYVLRLYVDETGRNDFLIFMEYYVMPETDFVVI